MRSDWTLTRLEMAIFVVAAAVVATGFVWASDAIGHLFATLALA
jgi:hypothetical protein